jgi:predicted nucleic acid-binding protein
LSNFLFDTNVFIQAKNLHYQFSFCKGFWDWVGSGHAHGLFYSSKKVYAELLDGRAEDEARIWAKSVPSSFFLEDAKVEEVMGHYSQVIRWAYQSQQYTPAAKAEFANEKIADAFLIALAKHGDYTIVTQEKSSPESKKKIFLPDAAKANGVKTVLIYDLLSSRATSTFQLAVV